MATALSTPPRRKAGSIAWRVARGFAAASLLTLVVGGVALENATALSQGKLAASVTEHARALSQKIAGRRGVDMESTIVVFAGATGSGKSSLFNAVIGRNLARVAVTRPTTSEPLAVYGNDCSALLDWLGVRTRHHP